jgi:hypothetical protein
MKVLPVILHQKKVDSRMVERCNGLFNGFLIITSQKKAKFML